MFLGGGSAYGDDLGGPSVAGLAALGTLDVPTESGVPNFPLAEDREEPAPASAAVTASDGQAGGEAGRRAPAHRRRYRRAGAGGVFP